MIGVFRYQHLAERECYGKHLSDPKQAAEHKGHRNEWDCYLMTWNPPPEPWVKRTKEQKTDRRSRRGYSSTGNRSWHLAIGIRRDSGHVQTHCLIGDGPGPFIWREKPTLKWQEEPGEWFCRRCVAEWTRGVHSVTVRVDHITVTKGQLEKLLAEVGGTEFRQITLKQTDIEGKPALLAITPSDDRNDDEDIRYLVAGNGVIRL